MIASLRKQFLARWTPEGYARLLVRLAAECDGPIPFRICETPCFLGPVLIEKLIASGRALIEQLSTPEYQALSHDAIPAAFRVPNEAPHPLFVQADFGLVRQENGAIVPQLVEIQGFPSLYAFQPVLAETYRETFGLSTNLTHHPEPLSNAGYHQLLGQTLLGGHAPENVVLLEIDPEHQKTRCDFVLTERRYGVRAVCITQVRKRGNKLYYSRDGVETPIHRIYNRAIIDEQLRRNIQPAFDWRDELDVEWAGHPNYYFRISKFSLPHLKHRSVPKTYFLDAVTEWPQNLDKWVLKPLYSFAGLGVKIGPSADDLNAIPPAERHNWILQERCDFTSLFQTPAGPTKAEVRVMYIWNNGPQAVSTIIRMGRGKMMGVDQNKNMEWVGASAGFWPR